MSEGLIAVVVFVGVTSSLLVTGRVVIGCWPWDCGKEREPKVKKPKEKGPEPGTIRIIEKMDEDGEVYYVAERAAGTNGDVWWPMSDDYGMISGKTPESVQQKANDEMQRRKEYAVEQEELRRRAAHHKVMGEFKP